MSLRRHAFALTLASIATLAGARPASADLVLEFSAPVYTITDIGLTTTVGILVSQTAAGPQVGVGNALLTAAVRLTYSPNVGVVGVNLINASGWDNLSTNTGTPGTVDISVVSLLGLSAPPIQIATVVFQGLGVGSANLTVQQLDSTSGDFITEQGDVLDPLNTATATIQVTQSAAIPEPSPLGLGFLMLGAAAAIRRFRGRKAA